MNNKADNSSVTVSKPARKKSPGTAKPVSRTRAPAARKAAAEQPAAPALDTATETQLQILRAETAYLRQRLKESEEQVSRLKATVSYRLGETLIHTRSFGDFLKLPSRLMDLNAVSREKRRAVSVPGAPPEDAAARDRRLQAARRAAALTTKAKELRGSNLLEAIRLGEEAVELEPKGFRMKWLASLTYDAGMLERPAILMERAWEAGETFSPDQAGRLEVLRGLTRVRRTGVAVPERTAPTYEPRPRAVAYVAASSLPHHQSGYTLRTHDLAKALAAAGWDVEALTRPGYPWDRKDAVKVDGGRLDYEVDGLTYSRLEGPGSNRTGLDQYIEASAQSLGAAFAARRPAVVHAASNHVNALPALIAARRVGVPFVYEVRGLWELTSAQRTAGGEAAERFQLMRDLEVQTAREADVVLAINESLKAELVERGIDADRIVIAPNSVDLARFHPIPRDDELKQMLGLSHRFVLGFVGSIVDYEGLDDAVDALALLTKGGVDAAMLIVGGGAAEEIILDKAQQLGLSDRVVMPGRVAPEAVPRYYSIIDAAIFPRKPVAVTETVSPLKPLEAMAMERPVIASNVAALAEMVEHDRTGLLFEKGDMADFATAVARVARDPDLAERLGKGGRAFVEAERTWQRTAARVSEVYETLLRSHG